MSDTFDAINKVYTCRADDVLTSGNKLIKLFMAEKKNVNTTEVEKNENKIRPGVCFKQFSSNSYYILKIVYLCILEKIKVNNTRQIMS